MVYQMIDPVVRSAVSAKYAGTDKKEVSAQCLDLIDDWMIIKSRRMGQTDTTYFTNLAKERLGSSDKPDANYYKSLYKAECRKYVLDNFDKSKVKSSLLLTIFLPMIIKWVATYIVNMIIDRWSKNK
jgi:hypothetical protein